MVECTGCMNKGEEGTAVPEQCENLHAKSLVI